MLGGRELSCCVRGTFLAISRPPLAYGGAALPVSMAGRTAGVSYPDSWPMSLVNPVKTLRSSSPTSSWPRTAAAPARRLSMSWIGSSYSTTRTGT